MAVIPLNWAAHFLYGITTCCLYALNIISNTFIIYKINLYRHMCVCVYIFQTYITLSPILTTDTDYGSLSLL